MLEDELRQLWCKETYIRGDGREHRWRDTQEISDIDATVKDNMFWNKLGVVSEISFEAEYVGRWASGCSCCELSESENQLSSAQAVRNRSLRSRTSRSRSGASQVPSATAARNNASHCPRKGCRAVELAAGTGLLKQMEVMASHRSRLMTYFAASASGGADSADTNCLLVDWVNARSKLFGYLGSKCGKEPLALSHFH